MTIAICDDEKIICDQIKALVKNQEPDCNIALFFSGEELLKEKKRFDIIVLDIKVETLLL